MTTSRFGQSCTDMPFAGLDWSTISYVNTEYRVSIQCGDIVLQWTAMVRGFEKVTR